MDNLARSTRFLYFVPIYLFGVSEKGGNEHFPGTDLFAVPIILLGLSKSGNAPSVPDLFIWISGKESAERIPKYPKNSRRASRAGLLNLSAFLLLLDPNTPKFSRRASRAGMLHFPVVPVVTVNLTAQVIKIQNSDWGYLERILKFDFLRY